LISTRRLRTADPVLTDLDPPRTAWSAARVTVDATVRDPESRLPLLQKRY